MKTLNKALLSTSLILLSTHSITASAMTENQMLTQCKALASAQFDDVTNTKVLKIKNSRFGFKSKFKVIGKQDRGVFMCTIAKGEDAQIARLDKKETEVIASH